MNGRGSEPNTVLTRNNACGAYGSEYPRIDSDTMLYSRQFDRIASTLRGMYDGPGQCQGWLVHDGRHVLVCCCSDLADAICYGGMHIHERRIYKAAQMHSVVDDGEGGRYIVPPERSCGYERCPFGNAVMLQNTIALREKGEVE